MRFFKDLKLSIKLVLGFGLMFILLVTSASFGFIGLDTMKSNFISSDVMSMDRVNASSVQSYLYDCRIIFKDYLRDLNSNKKQEFDNQFDELQKRIDYLNKSENLKDIINKIDFVYEKSNEYKNYFYKAIELTEEQKDILNGINLNASRMESMIYMEVQRTYGFIDKTLNQDLLNAYQSLLKSKLYLEYFINNYREIDQVKVSEYISDLKKWVDNALLRSNASVEILNNVRSYIDLYEKGFNDFVTLTKQRNETISQANNIGITTSSIVDEINQHIVNKKNKLSEVAKQSNASAVTGMIISAIISVVLSCLIIIIYPKLFIKPINFVADAFKKISEGEGDFNVRLMVGSKDEIGQMALYFNKFMIKLHSIMTSNYNYSWIKAGQAGLNEIMRGEQDLKVLATNIISYITKYVNAHQGILYIKEGSDIFRLYGSYATQDCDGLLNEFKVSEGILGQVVADKKPIIISNVPKDYVKICSGIGSSQPKNILAAPFIADDEVYGVLEIASLKEFSELDLQYIEDISESIAITIQTAESRIKMRDLLNKTIEQSEELQVQQEELIKSNMELEEQTKALKESQALLKLQQEELSVMNEELEDRTRTLELQKNDVSRKNERLRIAQKEIEEKARALEIISKYKSEFLANMSHELRTPLNSIIVLSQMLLAKNVNNLSEKQIEYAKTIHSSGEDLLKLINDILDLSKVEAGKMDIVYEKLYFSDLVDYINRSFTPMVNQKGIDLKVIVDDEVPEFIISDAQRVRQIVNNLVSNAFKFTSEGEIKVTISRPDKRYILPGEKTDDLISIAISDTGIGIPVDKQSIIFEAFRQSDGTTSRKYGGTGLGLSISREIAHLLGGRIELESEEGKGSTFYLIIPTKEKDISAESKNPLKDNDSNEPDIKKDDIFSDKVILIVDDDMRNVFAITSVLESQGFKVLVARDGNECIRRLEEHPEIDLILMDIMMPDMDGYTAMREIRKMNDYKDIPIIALTAKAMKDDRRKCIEAGANDYLTKPVDINKLNSILRVWLYK